MFKYHHLGIPTREVRAGERFLPEFGMYVSGYETSPFRIEWMRFEPDSPVSELIRRVPHLAFEVDDLEAAMAGKELIGEVSSPMDGVRVAMIFHNGMAVELLEFD